MQAWRFVKEKARQTSYFISGKSDAEKAVLEATNDDPWGPENTQMFQIARLTMNYNDYEDVKKAMWEQMSDIDEVRHVQKSLLLLEYLLRNGNERLRGDSRMELGQLQRLTSLQMHETGELAALEAVIRKKAADIIQIINDDDLYKMEREKAKKLNGSIASVSGNTDNFNSGSFGNSYNYNSYGQDSFNQTSYDNHESNNFDNNYNDKYSFNDKQNTPEPDEDEELDFNPRANVQNSAAPQQPQQQQSFDPFGNQQQQPQQQSFDPFGNQQQQPQQQNLFGGNQQQGFDPFGNSQPQQQNLFGGNQQQNLFGGNQQQNLFGGNQQRQQQNLFGGNQQPQQQNLFGGNQQPQQQNLFGGNQQPQQQNLFGGNQQPQQQNLFGGNQQPQQQNLFGGNQQPQQNQGFDMLDFTQNKPQQPAPNQGFGQPMGNPQQHQQPKPTNDFGGLVDLNLANTHQSYGKAQQARGNGPTLGGF